MVRVDREGVSNNAIVVP